MNYSEITTTEMILFERFLIKGIEPKFRCENEEHLSAMKEYVKLAKAMPYEEILRALYEYDESSPKMDELQFIKDLQNQYNQTEENVLRRIKYIRKLSSLPFKWE